LDPGDDHWPEDVAAGAILGVLPGQEALGEIAARVYRFPGDAWKHIAPRNAQQKAGVGREMVALKLQLERDRRANDDTIHLVADDCVNFGRLRQDLNRYFQAWDGVQLVSAPQDGS
jgi:hypothetical protein